MWRKRSKNDNDTILSKSKLLTSKLIAGVITSAMSNDWESKTPLGRE